MGGRSLREEWDWLGWARPRGAAVGRSEGSGQGHTEAAGLPRPPDAGEGAAPLPREEFLGVGLVEDVAGPEGDDVGAVLEAKGRVPERAGVFSCRVVDRPVVAVAVGPVDTQ